MSRALISRVLVAGDAALHTILVWWFGLHPIGHFWESVFGRTDVTGLLTMASIVWVTCAISLALERIVREFTERVLYVRRERFH
jgi:hypothetical protein